MLQGNAISWFEIPTTDLDRAQKFYEAVFAMPFFPFDMPGIKMVAFPTDMMGPCVGGALVYAPEMCQPSDKGTMVYLNTNPDLQVFLDRVEGAGGKIEMPKTEISPEIGFMAVIIDTEGNRVGLHSSPQPA